MTLFLPLADIGSAFTGFANLMVTYLGPILTVAIIIVGYTYMFASEVRKASEAKDHMGRIVVGSILIAVAATLAAKLVTSIGH